MDSDMCVLINYKKNRSPSQPQLDHARLHQPKHNMYLSPRPVLSYTEDIFLETVVCVRNVVCDRNPVETVLSGENIAFDWLWV